MILPNETGLVLMASLMNPEVVLLLHAAKGGHKMVTRGNLTGLCHSAVPCMPYSGTMI
jgi:hypothetical protein